MDPAAAHVWVLQGRSTQGHSTQGIRHCSVLLGAQGYYLMSQCLESCGTMVVDARACAPCVLRVLDMRAQVM